MIKIGANILSLTIQRNLGRATTDLSTSSERLASGQRINKASDDAAGLAIATSLQTKTRVFSQGIRNLNDGLSAVNIAEGAMNELGEIITRIEELATQGSSGTFSDKQRESLQKEAVALTAEWNRILESTSFNGQNLLTGENTRTVLQGGVGTEATLAVQIGASSAGVLTRVSTTSSGAETNGDSNNFAITPDGRYLLFRSDGSNVVSGDTNGTFDLFVKDFLTGTTTRATITAAGVEPTTQADTGLGNTISADGRYVVFSYVSSNLVSGDTNLSRDIFLKDLQTGTLSRISTASDGSEGAGVSSRPAISSDGRYVVFGSTASNLVANDTNGVLDVFVKDTETGTTMRVSTDSAGSQTTNSDVTSNTQLSADGRFVLFSSDSANLVAGDTNGVTDIFLKDLLTGSTTRVNTSSNGSQTTLTTLRARLSDDARFVVFDTTDSTLVAGDTNGLSDSFVKDLQTGTLTRVSVSSTGAQSTGGVTGSAASEISADGRYVVFGSDATNLVSNDSNGKIDIFRRDLLSNTTERISNADSGTQGDLDSTNPVVSGDGRYVLFGSSATNLIAGDANGKVDAFIKDMTTVGVQRLAGVVVSNRASARISIDLAQRYRTELQDYRSKLGATTSRIQTFVNTLQSSTINYQAASSRITDTDIAEEAAKQVASSIRQQVATALLGQANQTPQIALNLLRNA